MDSWLHKRRTAAACVVMVCTCYSLAADAGQASCFCLRQVVDKLHNPVEYIEIRRGDSVRTLVVEQRGVVRSFLRGGAEESHVFMDIRDRVVTSNSQGEERGLLSVALHPRYTQARVGRIFCYYIRNVSGEDYAYVSEFAASDDEVDVMSEKTLLRVRQPFVSGNGGQLLFGDDGYLYIFTGDGTGQDDKQGNAQNLRSFLGKALRVDVDHQAFQQGDSASGFLYQVPQSNPFVAQQQDTRPEIFAVGLRNPWRCTLDSQSRGGSGRVFCGDPGTDLFEEINMIEKGRNYGWNIKEGEHCFNALNCTTQIEDEALPIYTCAHSPDWGSAVVAGHVYRGRNFSDITGSLVYGDAVTGQTFLLTERTGGNWTSREWSVCPESRCPCHARHEKSPFLLAFGQGADGEVMLLMTNEFTVLQPQGTVYQVVPPLGAAEQVATCGASLPPTARILVLMLLHFGHRIFF